jgi:hypothetical protein
MSRAPGRVEAAPARGPAPLCRNCRSFSGAALALEAAFPGMTAMGSGFSAVRAADGVCGLHDRYLSADSSCAHFSAVLL